MGYLEIQVLGGDKAARRAVGRFHDFCEGVLVGAGNVVYIKPDVASTLEEVAALTPLVISLDHLLAVPYDSALGQEHFSVTVHPGAYEPLEDDQRCDVIELSSGEMDFAAILPHDTPWPHVMVHRAYPRRHAFSVEFKPILERAFLAALRDAMRPLATPPIPEPLDPAA